MPHTREFNHALRWLAAGRLAAQVVSWVITILVIRLLTPADYGLAAMVSTVISLISMIAEFGFGTAIVQANEISKEESASVFGAAIVFGALSSIVVAILAPLAAAFYGEPRIEGITQIAACSFFISALATLPDAQLRRALRFKEISFADFLSTLVGSISTYILALAGKGVWALVVGPLIASACRLVILHVIVTDRILPSLKLGKALQLIRFGGQVAVARIAGYAVSQSDFLIAGRFLGKDALGHYSVALDLAMLPLSKIMNIVNQAALPALAKISREQHTDQQKMLLNAHRLMSYVIFPGLWGIAAVSPWLIPALLGEQWGEAVLPLQIVCLVLPLRMVSTLVSTATVSFGRADIELRDKLTSTFIFPLAFLIGTRYGVIGLACAWCVALPLTLGINLFRTRRVFNLAHCEVALALARPAAISGLMAILVYGTGWTLGTHAATWAAILLMVIEGAVAYALMLWFQDRAAMLSLLDVVSPGLRKRLQPNTETT
jgi:O-antigen/teichoic acid export membrane protein